MKRMRFLTGLFVIAFAFAIASNTTYANSCCGVKKDAHECNKECASGCVNKISASEGSENTCPVCGQAADSKGKQIDTKHAGETVHLCCEGCLNAYNQNPDKYSKVEKPKESYRAEPPKPKKQRGEGYY